jgi:hypothetical protein
MDTSWTNDRRSTRKNCLQVIQVLQSKFRNNIERLVLLLIYSIVN